SLRHLEPFDTSKLLLENGALYFDSRGIYGRAYGPKGSRWLWPSMRDVNGYAAIWADLPGRRRERPRARADARTDVRRLCLPRRGLSIEGQRASGGAEAAWVSKERPTASPPSRGRGFGLSDRSDQEILCPPPARYLHGTMLAVGS